MTTTPGENSARGTEPGLPAFSGAFLYFQALAYRVIAPIFGLRTDARAIGPEERINLMIEQSLVVLASSLDEVLPKLSELKRRAVKTREDPQE